MKYKAKFNASTPSLVVVQNHEDINVGDILTPNENNISGVVVFIPFTDTRFFEPVKTRTFQVEVSEEHVGLFDYVNSDQEWTVTEITETEWIKQFKAQYPYSANEFRNEQLESFNPGDLIAEYGSAKSEALKWIKYQYNVGLKAAKDLMDYTYANFQ